MSKHTPLPWQDGPIQKSSNFGNYRVRIYGVVDDPMRPDATTFASVAHALGGVSDDGDVAKENAAFIVQACNNYDRLTAQNARLREALQWVEKWIVRHNLNTAELINGKLGEVPILATIRSALSEGA